jgi:hypothetical protein
MKRCGKCKRTLPLARFHRYRDRHQDWCKDCKRAYAAEYYDRNRAERTAYNARQRREAAAWYSSLKEGRPCTDCGGVFHPAAMQWDHPPGVEKLAHVAELYRGRRDRVLAEIAKCELVCANCHAVRTSERRRSAPAPSPDGAEQIYPDGAPP